MENCRAFTSKYIGISNKLINTVELINGDIKISAQAQWDTGATNSCISHDVVSKLHLISTGFVQNHTPSGIALQPTYKIDVCLPNHLNVESVQVSESEIGSQGIDILIGMDIICLGDFAISNCDGNTIFTFRYPSIAETDYVKLVNVNTPVRKNKIQPNALCPCGSGKKYKRCCGKINF